ncbi:cytochrome P450 4d2-like isoform X2 [Schistocerca cancellata]|uniref:cytochrome P450 4d2-like isoform X2 n=1 Tax=Schistocerca cancellata TaxID=274614 RepID=UPI0021195C89|nr:cytochrome P450 4d2-like isoform X2 [Schistocerca cancellata]
MSVWTACWQGLGLVVGALLAVFSWLWITRPRTNAPGPTPLPLLGNLPHFWRNLPVVVNDFRKLQRQYGDVFRFYIGPKLILIATQPDDAKRLLVGCKMRERDDYTTRALIPFSGYGLIVNKGELWKTHRKLIEPTFHAEVLHGYTEAFNKGAQFLCSQLAEANGNEVDISKMLLHTSFHFLTLSMYGVSFDELEPDRKKQAVAVDVFISGLELIQKRFYQPWLQIDWIISLTPDGEALKRQLNLYNGMAKQGLAIMRERRSKALPKKRKTFMDVMMDDHGNLLLPENEVYDEESLRLFPAVPVAPVFASEDIPLSGGRYVAPRGSVVFVFLNLLHRQPAIYPDPDKFDPGRFLEGGGSSALPPYSYLPFGAGSRLCVGARFAMLVMKTVLATVMRQFRIIPGSTREELEEIAVFVTGKPVHGINIRCVPRTAPVTVDCT